MTVVAATAVLLAPGCSSQPPVGDPFGGAPGAQNDGAPVLLTVDNQDFRDATVWANWNGPKHRLGSVTGKTQKTFEMVWRDYEVWFEIDFLGGGGLRSDRLPVFSGDHLDFIILPQW